MWSFFSCVEKFCRTLLNYNYKILKNMISLEYAQFFLRQLKKLYKTLSKYNNRILNNMVNLNMQSFLHMLKNSTKLYQIIIIKF